MTDFQLFHVDDCMYVAAASKEDVIRHVKADGCWGPDEPEIEEASLDLRVTRANTEDGEEATPESMTTAGVLVEEHLERGGTLPETICFDAGM